MIRFEHALDIRRPIEDVFTFLADFTNIPRWNFYVEEVQKITDGPVGAGTIYAQVRRSDRQRYKTAMYEWPHSVRVVTLPGERPAFDRQLHLQRAGEGSTRLHDRWELDTGHPELLQRLAAGRIRDGVGENLAILKELLEHGEATLQDGRRTRMGSLSESS